MKPIGNGKTGTLSLNRRINFKVKNTNPNVETLKVRNPIRWKGTSNPPTMTADEMNGADNPAARS